MTSAPPKADPTILTIPSRGITPGELRRAMSEGRVVVMEFPYMDGRAFRVTHLVPGYDKAIFDRKMRQTYVAFAVLAAFLAYVAYRALT